MIDRGTYLTLIGLYNIRLEFLVVLVIFYKMFLYITLRKPV